MLKLTEKMSCHSVLGYDMYVCFDLECALTAEISPCFNSK